MRTDRLVFVILAGLFFALPAVGEQKMGQKKDDGLTLEKLFPEESVFGPSASNTAFSYDGRYGAYLWRPYIERRHGPDLWLYDVQTGQAKRITTASVMASFQKSTRKVVKDRIAKAKKEKPKKEKTADKDPNNITAGEKDGNDPNEQKLKAAKAVEDEKKLKEKGDWVSENDGKDKKAPRYGGISYFVWSETADELLFISEGDIYRFTAADEKISRITNTKESESSIRYLPDGSGILFRRSAGLFRMDFATGRSEQVEPRFSPGESMREYELSPDGRSIVFITSKELKPAKESRVEIANYRNRLMQAKEVSRQVSDDTPASYETGVYLYRINDPQKEDGRLVETYRKNISRPGSFVGSPAWSPDSSRAAFVTFDHDSGIVEIRQMSMPDKPAEPNEALKETKEKTAEGEQENQVQQQDAQAQSGYGPDDEERKRQEPPPPEKIEKSPSELMYAFLHTGGPNTPNMIRLYYLSDNRRIVYLSEQTGFRHLNILEPLYESFTPLTQGMFEVYPIDITKDRKWIYIRATKEHPSCTDVYRVSTETGEMIRLTKTAATYNSPAVSQDGQQVLAVMSSYNFLPDLVYINSADDTQKTLTDSHPEQARKLTEAKPEFFDYKNRHGHTIYGHIFRPDDRSSEDKRPVLIYFYGGPLGTRKMVYQGNYDTSGYRFGYYMAKKHGYVTCTIDPRGNSGYAGIFEKANYGQVGKPQVEDIVDCVKYLVKNESADPNRVAIHGWSFGGFQTQMCMYSEPNVFAAGIAGAGPTEWENYNIGYTTMTIGTSQPGSQELKKFSLLPLAKNLKGKLLLVHGIEDSNVLYQDTVKVYRELLKAGKETLVELFLDPTGGHGLGGDVKELSKFRKYEDFLIKSVGQGVSVKKPEPEKQQPGQSAEPNHAD